MEGILWVTSVCLDTSTEIRVSKETTDKRNTVLTEGEFSRKAGSSFYINTLRMNFIMQHMKKIQSSHLATTWAVYTAYIAAITLAYVLTLFA